MLKILNKLIYFLHFFDNYVRINFSYPIIFRFKTIVFFINFRKIALIYRVTYVLYFQYLIFLYLFLIKDVAIICIFAKMFDLKLIIR